MQGTFRGKYLRVNLTQGTTTVEEFPDLYYRMEGWDPATGWPTFAKLAELGIEWAAKPGDAW